MSWVHTCLVICLLQTIALAEKIWNWGEKSFKIRLGTQKPTAKFLRNTKYAQPGSLKPHLLGDFISQASAPENRILTSSWSFIKAVESFEGRGKQNKIRSMVLDLHTTSVLNTAQIFAWTSSTQALEDDLFPCMKTSGYLKIKIFQESKCQQPAREHA